MRNSISGFTIIEALIGITLLAVIVGSILGIFIVVQRYFKDGVALTDSMATARTVIERIVRPSVREGSGFSVSDNGNTLTVTGYDSSVNTFTFNNGDGNDATFGNNTIEKNGTTISANIVKIAGENVFEQITANELVGINYGVRNEGIAGHFKEVHISTEIKLRN